MFSAARRRAVTRREAWLERRAFARLDPIACDCTWLARDVIAATLDNALRSERTVGEWRRVEPELAALGITDKAGGVNPGDRRAVYALVRHFRARVVLEIGTHIGASTSHTAAALRTTRDEEPSSDYRLTSIDVEDVNDPVAGSWLRNGSTHAPAELVRRLGMEELVSFVTQSSLDYLVSCDERFDFVFLDGDHAPATVYQEVPDALRLLRPGGVVLLHDYFPEQRPLWSNGAVIAGPWLATERLRSEGAEFDVLPLGDLPWPTKLGSHTTSLALLVGRETLR
jgi:predicted O-methyltransferase YrrM